MTKRKVESWCTDSHFGAFLIQVSRNTLIWNISMVIKKAVLQKRSGLWVSLVMLSDVVLSRLVSNTGVGCHALLQGIFPSQRLNPHLLHCRWILYCLSHQGSPRMFITLFIFEKTKKETIINRLLFSCKVVSDSFVTPWTVPARLLCLWDFPSKNTGMGCHFLLHQ